jgi:hypothetical protein
MRIGLKFGAKTSSRCMRIGALSIFGAMALPLLTSHAFAQSCNQDFQKLIERRMSAINALNAMKAANHGKLDAEAACPKIRNLAAVDAEVAAYAAKNKDWCNIPDNIVTQTEQSRVGDANMAVKACNMAAQIRKAKQQQAEGGGTGAPAAPKLPSGPL